MRYGVDGRRETAGTSRKRDRVLAENLRGAFLCSKHATIEIRKRGNGSIVCISSLSRLVSHAGQTS